MRQEGWVEGAFQAKMQIHKGDKGKKKNKKNNKGDDSNNNKKTGDFPTCQYFKKTNHLQKQIVGGDLM